jgi:hypothetical protein
MANVPSSTWKATLPQLPHVAMAVRPWPLSSWPGPISAVTSRLAIVDRRGRCGPVRAVARGGVGQRQGVVSWVVVNPWKWPLSTCPATASRSASENGFSTRATPGSSLPWEARTGRA